MPNESKLLRIFAASPSDVEKERRSLESIIGELKPLTNFVGARLEVMDWRKLSTSA